CALYTTAARQHKENICLFAWTALTGTAKTPYSRQNRHTAPIMSAKLIRLVYNGQKNGVAKVATLSINLIYQTVK
ncbi:MAG: hypothetical protein ACI9WS_002511, partial [Paraglaciecola psychrophila]